MALLEAMQHFFLYIIYVYSSHACLFGRAQGQSHIKYSIFEYSKIYDGTGCDLNARK